MCQTAQQAEEQLNLGDVNNKRGKMSEEGEFGGGL